MFHFESLELLYWDYWERVRIPFDERIIVIVGPNGSGKTTLLDAMRTLLGIKTSAKRDYKRYARRSNKPHSWIVAVVKNIKDSSNRPCFYPLFTDKVTLACRIEKKGGEWQRGYFVKPGVVPIEDLLDSTSSEMLGLREYRSILERAGLSGAMLRVLSLEQGATDRLCEYSAKELLYLVYEAFGDRSTLDNYEKAREDQIEAERELEGLRLNVEKLENQLSTLTNRVNNYREYDSLVKRKNYLETEVTARAEYVTMKDNIDGLSRNITGMKREIEPMKRKISGLETRIKELKELDTSLRRDKDGAGEGIRRLQETLIEENRKRATIETTLSEITRLKALAEGVEPIDMEHLENRYEETLKESVRREDEIEAMKNKATEVESSLSALKAGIIRPERPAEEFSQAMKSAGISHRFLFDGIEITDEKWRLAIESIMRGYRYIIVLKNPADRWKAWQMGEESGYRHFIVSGTGSPDIPSPSGSALEAVRLKQWVPEWISRLLADIYLVDTVRDGKALSDGSTFVTAKGYLRERRGGRSISVSEGDFIFGVAARKRQIEFLGKELLSIRQQISLQEEGLRKKRELIEDLKTRLQQQEALQGYLSRREEEQRIGAELNRIIASIKTTEKRIESLNDSFRLLSDRHTQACVELSNSEKELERLRVDFNNRLNDCKQLRSESFQKIREFRKYRLKIPPHWRTPEQIAGYKEQFGDIRNVKMAIAQVQVRIDEGEWEKDPRIIDLKAKVEQDYKYELDNLKRKEYEFSETRRVTEDARAAYIDILRASIRFYERNLKALATLAGVEIEVTKPRLENDDTLLKEAGIEVKWNFDGKGLISTDDGEASGGQQVIKSLILLIALMMDDRSKGGFVFIDEPFAHLDVFNIDRVAEFLLATETQFIVTTPNTHNTNIYRPAMLSIVTKKKSPSGPFAPPPAHIRRLNA